MLDGTLAIPSFGPRTRQPDQPFKFKRGVAETSDSSQMLAVIAADIDDQPSPVPVNRARSITIWLHLLSIGAVAAATIGIFLGVGFVLLLQEVHGSRGSGPVAAAETPKAVLPLRQVEAPAAPVAVTHAAAAAGAVAHIPPAIAAPVKFAASYRSLPEHAAELAPAGAGPEATDPAHRLAQAAPPAEPPLAKPIKAVAAAAPPQTPKRSVARLPAAEVTALLARGDQFLRAGDVASARLFYERAADAGDGQAALREAATFDPAFLANAGLRGTLGDAAKAHWWYARAHQSESGEEIR